MIDIPDHEGQLYENPTNLGPGNFKVLVGGNNSGKSTLLRFMCRNRSDAHLVNVNRSVITGEGAFNKDYSQNKTSYSAQVRDAVDDNVIGKNIQVLQELMSLSDSDRKKVLNYYNQYFPSKAVIKREDPKNSASAKILTMHGYSITKQGSGARAVLEILIKLFDSSINVLCVDEPEFALEPRLQKSLFNALKEKSKEKQIVLATHSHHFLDREDISNNYVCRRNNRKKIQILQVKNEVEVRNIVFRLLGSELSDLSLPERLIIVEGASDVSFIEKIAILKGKKYSFFAATSDSKIKPAIEGITQYLQFIDTLAPVYLDKIWIIADKQTDNIKVRQWNKILHESSSNKKVLVLAENGIEYFYPESLLQSIFNTDESKEIILTTYLRTNPNEYNGIAKTKKQLATLISSQLTEENLEPSEVVDFVNQLP